MSVGNLLGDKYRIERELGKGGAGITFLVRDAQSGELAVAKLLHLDLLQDWKAVELFEREAAILKALHHERIPAYIDFFRAEIDGRARFVLLRQFVEGASLQEKVGSGWRATEQQICDIGARLLVVVGYIHSVRPPVIHRDINPRNVILRQDGEIFLVDFGGVQDAIRVSGSASSTIIGTPGFTPLEQFVGRASVRSDLYAVAATLLFLLTHRNPIDFPTKDMKIDFRSVVDVSSPGLARVLTNWLEPDDARRTLSVPDAAALLRGEELAAAESALLAEPQPVPYGSRIRLQENGGKLAIVIPERGGRRSVFGGFGVFWIGIVGFWTYSAVTAGAPVPFGLISLPFWAIGFLMISRSLYSLFGRVGFVIEENGLTFTRRFLFLRRRESMPLSEVGQCFIEEGRASHRGRHRHDRRFETGSTLALELGARTVRFGGQLSPREQQWLRDRINAEVRRLRG
ncbi:MAG TPA: serine/threonine-protein kinase [Spirochaetia bacterium]|nr:serine/threonine-protein kinase [Spirochaetia bacterium]